MSFLPLVVIVAAIGLLLFVSFTHRGRGDRTKLLWVAVLALTVAVLARELSGPLGHVPVLDLFKRIALVASETGAMLLVLTFRRESITRRTGRIIWAVAAAVSVLQAVLLPTVPLLPDGTVPPYSDVVGIPGPVAYFAVNQFTLITFVAVGATGCIRALRNARQPRAAKISLILLLTAGACIVVYASTGLALLVGLPMDHDAVIQRVMLLVTIISMCASLAVGGIHKIVGNGQRRAAVNTATDIIEPLWNVVTTLRPDVVIDFPASTRYERLTRLTIETNDALALIRNDAADALTQLRAAHPSEPDLTAGLLAHLAGSDALPPLDKRLDSNRLLRVARRLGNDSLSASVFDLYRVRDAFARARRPATVQTA